MRRSFVIPAAIALLALTTGGVLADDFAPPEWRDNTNPEVNRSTWQQWEFRNSDDGNIIPVVPDAYVNPLFDPANPFDPVLGAAILHTPGNDWMSEHEGRIGVWPLGGGGMMTILIPNYPGNPGPGKEIRVQLTWTPLDPQDPGDVPVFDGFGEAPHLIPINLESTNHWDAEGVWVHTLAVLTFETNPLSEMINITGDILVDEVVIDTICPEPATMLLLGLAAPFVLKHGVRR